MATYVKGLNVSAAISASNSRSSNGSTTLYTNPSNTAYAIINVNATSTSTAVGQITIDARGFLAVAAAQTYTISSVVLGPSQAIVIEMDSGSGTISCAVTGVLIANQT